MLNETNPVRTAFSIILIRVTSPLSQMVSSVHIFLLRCVRISRFPLLPTCSPISPYLINHNVVIEQYTLRYITVLHTLFQLSLNSCPLV